jgi:hypothetical protein
MYSIILVVRREGGTVAGRSKSIRVPPHFPAPLLVLCCYCTTGSTERMTVLLHLMGSGTFRDRQNENCR